MKRTPRDSPESVSGALERWLAAEGEPTLGSLIDLFGRGSFALVFVLLLGVPALPLPTGGATHVFEVIAVLLAIELIAGRNEIWLPDRWRKLDLAGPRKQKFIRGLMKLIRRLERISRPRLSFLFDHRLSNIVFGAVRGRRLDSRVPRAPVHGARHPPSAGSGAALTRRAARGHRGGVRRTRGRRGRRDARDRAREGGGLGDQQPLLTSR